jgi:EAL domain-containing protein (putative c-di-GMP-specific phosphodiesterase class I)
VSSIIALAHGLEISVVGEGVETEAQRQLLCLMRCDEAQGYLHSRPMPKASLEAMLRLEATNARE